jgi:hypothetical protein
MIKTIDTTVVLASEDANKGDDRPPRAVTSHGSAIALPLKRFVPDNCRQPGFEVWAGKAVECAQIGFLHDVVGINLIALDPKRHIEGGIYVRQCQSLESG